MLDLFYRLGRGSTDETRRILEAIAGQTAGIAIHIDRITPHLRYEILKWKRRQLIASLKNADPARVAPPATVRAALLEAFIESKQKLVQNSKENSKYNLYVDIPSVNPIADKQNSKENSKLS